MNARNLALGLGVFSIGIGLAELIAPRQIAKSLGMKKRGTFFRVCGIRELTTGIGILSLKKKSPWIWARVAGDALDLATMSMAWNSRGKCRRNAAVAAASVAAIAALDIFCGRRLALSDR